MSDWMTVQLCAAAERPETSLFGRWWESLTAFFRIEANSGAYWALAFAAAVYLAGTWIAAKKAPAGAEQEQVPADGCAGSIRRMLIVCAGWFVLLLNPFTMGAFEKITGVSYRMVYAALAIPILPVTAWAAAKIWERCDFGTGPAADAPGRRISRPLCAALFLTAALALAGTVYPFDEKAGTIRRGDQWNEAEAGAVEAVLAEADKLKEAGQVPLLAAPKWMMDTIRRYDADILLAYGRNLWQTDALPLVNDRYSEEQIVLCQAMEAETFQAAETAELALAYGCNLIALKEPLSPAFLDNWGLSCVYEAESVYVYSR